MVGEGWEGRGGGGRGGGGVGVAFGPKQFCSHPPNKIPAYGPVAKGITVSFSLAITSATTITAKIILNFIAYSAVHTTQSQKLYFFEWHWSTH